MSDKKPKTNRNTKADLEYRLQARRIDRWANFAKFAWKWTCLRVIFGLIARALTEVAPAFAGRETKADILLVFLADAKIRLTVYLLTVSASLAFGWRQRSLRLAAIETMGNRISFLEAEIDERRTSSRITRRGTTRPEDD